MHAKEFQFTLKKEFSSHDFGRAIAKRYSHNKPYRLYVKITNDLEGFLL